MLVDPNFEFRCTRFQLTPAKYFFVSVNPVAGPADPLINLLGPQFNLNVPNFSCFGKLTIMFF